MWVNQFNKKQVRIGQTKNLFDSENSVMTALDYALHVMQVYTITAKWYSVKDN